MALKTDFRHKLEFYFVRMATFIDLSKYKLSEQFLENPDFVRWSRHALDQIAGVGKYHLFKNIVAPEVYELDLETKIEKVGLCHFVMNEDDCKYACRATDKTSPYWYSILHGCHYTANYQLLMARHLFPKSKWRIVYSEQHSFVTNCDLRTIVGLILSGRVSVGEYSPNAPMIFDIVVPDHTDIYELFLDSGDLEFSEYADEYEYSQDILMLY